MNYKYLLLTLIATILSWTCGFAQNTCQYTLQLFDNFGDGWSGSQVNITVNEETNSFVLDGENDNGLFRAFDISLTTGDTITIEYIPGSFEADVSYAFYNPEGILLFQDGPEPTAGVVFAARLNCPTCFVPNPNSVAVDDIRAFFADISWQPTEPEATYQIEFGPTGFPLGAGSLANTKGRATRLQGLAENTTYDFYLRTICVEGDTSRTIGPYQFQTLWAVDVGITEIVGPETMCAIGFMDSIKVVIQNFGGLPQANIPFKFSVNGMEGGVPIPLDGFYTGALGTDSMVTVAFETLFDFTQPNEYAITAWTEFEGDSDLSNDTSTVTITNIPVISSYPYFEDFEIWPGGWLVDAGSQNPSWAFGRPAGSKIRGATSGQNAWVTNLDGLYNNDEFSVLESPCLDFSSLTEDPRFAFSINFDSEECCDEAWVEVSIDGGEVWEKLGVAGTGFNWYNDAEDNWWSGDGGFDGWVTAFNTLEGTAGQPNVRLRFVFSSDPLLPKEGIGIDDIFISTPLSLDAAGISAAHSASDDCGSAEDVVQLVISNFGTEAISGFEVSYQINGGPIVTENIGAVMLNAEEQFSFSFAETFDSSVPGTYEIKAWTNLEGDAFIRNDTARYVFATAAELPFEVDFEQGFLPSGWSTDEDVVITNEHSNTSFVLSNNMWNGDQSFEAVTPVVGPIETGDSLNFDYRFVDLIGNGEIPTILTANDQLVVQISRDCGENYETALVIESTNHVITSEMTEVNIPLAAYVGGYIRIRFIGTWGGGDYFVDIDNVFIPRCTGSLALSASVTNATSGNADGSVSIEAGSGADPYSYLWDTGDTTQTVSGLASGSYSVTVTDRFGCSDNRAVTVDVAVGTSEPTIIDELAIAPNPTADRINLSISLREESDLDIQVINLLGQKVFEKSEQYISRGVYQIDLSNYDNGLFEVRIRAGNDFITKKVLKIR